MSAPPPYPPGPYPMTPPPMKHRTEDRTKIMVILVVVVIVLGCTMCALVMYMGPIMYPTLYHGSGNQQYQGVPNKTQLMFDLSAAGFAPTVDAGQTGPRVDFKPFCGAKGSAQAAKSVNVMSMDFIDFDDYNNTTTVTFMTNRYTSSQYDKNNVSDSLKCVMERTKAILTVQEGLKVLEDSSNKEKYITPGYDAVMVVPALVIISLVWRRRMKAAKK